MCTVVYCTAVLFRAVVITFALTYLLGLVEIFRHLIIYFTETEERNYQ